MQHRAVFKWKLIPSSYISKCFHAFFKSSPKDIFSLLLERQGGERNIDVTEKHGSVASRMRPDLGSNRNLGWLDDAPTYWATPARACSSFSMRPSSLWPHMKCLKTIFLHNRKSTVSACRPASSQIPLGPRGALTRFASGAPEPNTRMGLPAAPLHWPPTCRGCLALVQVTVLTKTEDWKVWRHRKSNILHFSF